MRNHLGFLILHMNFKLTRQIAELCSRVAMRAAEEHGETLSVTVCSAKMQSTFAFDESKDPRHIHLSNQRANLANVTAVPTKSICEFDESKTYTLAYKLALAALKLIMPTNRNPAVFTDLVSVKTIEIAFMSCMLPDISNVPGPDTVIADPFPDAPFRKSVETAEACLKEVGPGGVPLIFQGTLIGSIGCSGSENSARDHEYALHGAQAAALLISGEALGTPSAFSCDAIVDEIFANTLDVSEQVTRDTAWAALLQYEKQNWSYE